MKSKVEFSSTCLKRREVRADAFRYFFAAFKWYWVNTISYRLQELNCLKCGLTDETIEFLIQRYFGSRLRFAVLTSAVSLFLIPVITQAVVDHSCFYHYFEADTIHTVATSDLKYCAAAGFSFTDIVHCPQNDILTEPQFFTIDADIPFLYNYTCAASIVTVYVPLYMDMYCFILLKCLIHYIYLAFEAKQDMEKRERSALTAEEEKIDQNTAEVSWSRLLFTKTITLNNLMTLTSLINSISLISLISLLS